MNSLKEFDEYHEFQDIYRKMKDYVLNGGLKNYIIGTKNELMETSRSLSLFEGTTFLLEAMH